MPNAFVLATCMPPTRGHLNLIQFAAELADEVTVIVCTQPSEPLPTQRFIAVRDQFAGNPKVEVLHLHRELEQNPEAEGFWDMWVAIMRDFGFRDRDYCVSSELYGQTMADLLNGVFIPYDPDRELHYTKATNIRCNPVVYFSDIMPSFQKNLVTRVTIFGAESTGKTTLSKALSEYVGGSWLFEWARPYLEAVGPEINIEKMTNIWKGQLATQRHAEKFYDYPLIIQDTDLFSTIGYWEQPHWESELGPVPEELIRDGMATKSDLYIITKSDIPFEQDPLRYGGTKRESSDEYWINVANKYGLNYIVLDTNDQEARVRDAADALYPVSGAKTSVIAYDRHGL